MRELTGAILVLAGSVLFGAGMIANAISPYHGREGYVPGIVIALIGLWRLFGGAIRRGWDAIPTDHVPREAPKSGEAS